MLIENSLLEGVLLRGVLLRDELLSGIRMLVEESGGELDAGKELDIPIMLETSLELCTSEVLELTTSVVVALLTITKLTISDEPDAELTRAGPEGIVVFRIDATEDDVPTISLV